MTDVAGAWVRIMPDLDEFRTELKAGLERAMAGMDKRVEVNVSGDLTRLRTSLAQGQAQVAAFGRQQANVSLGTDGLVRVKTDITAASAAAADFGRMRVRASVGLEGVPETVAEFAALSAALGAFNAPVGIAARDRFGTQLALPVGGESTIGRSFLSDLGPVVNLNSDLSSSSERAALSINNELNKLAALDAEIHNIRGLLQQTQAPFADNLFTLPPLGSDTSRFAARNSLAGSGGDQSGILGVASNFGDARVLRAIGVPQQLAGAIALSLPVVVSFGTALLTAAAGITALGVAAAPTVVAIAQGYSAVDKATEAVNAAIPGTTAWVTATGQLSQAWQGVDPALRGSVAQIQQLFSGNSPVMRQVQGWVTGLISNLTSRFSGASSVFMPLITATEDAVNRLVSGAERLAGSGYFKTFIDDLAHSVGPAIQGLSSLVVQIVKFFAALGHAAGLGGEGLNLIVQTFRTLTDLARSGPFQGFIQGFVLIDRLLLTVITDVLKVTSAFDRWLHAPIFGMLGALGGVYFAIDRIIKLMSAIPGMQALRGGVAGLFGLGRAANPELVANTEMLASNNAMIEGLTAQIDGLIAAVGENTAAQLGAGAGEVGLATGAATGAALGTGGEIIGVGAGAAAGDAIGLAAGDAAGLAAGGAVAGAVESTGIMASLGGLAAGAGSVLSAMVPLIPAIIGLGAVAYETAKHWHQITGWFDQISRTPAVNPALPPGTPTRLAQVATGSPPYALSLGGGSTFVPSGGRFARVTSVSSPAEQQAALNQAWADWKPPTPTPGDVAYLNAHRNQLFGVDKVPPDILFGIPGPSAMVLAAQKYANQFTAIWQQVVPAAWEKANMGAVMAPALSSMFQQTFSSGLFTRVSPAPAQKLGDMVAGLNSRNTQFQTWSRNLVHLFQDLPPQMHGMISLIAQQAPQDIGTLVTNLNSKSKQAKQWVHDLFAGIEQEIVTNNVIQAGLKSKKPMTGMMNELISEVNSGNPLLVQAAIAVGTAFGINMTAILPKVTNAYQNAMNNLVAITGGTVGQLKQIFAQPLTVGQTFVHALPGWHGQQMASQAPASGVGTGPISAGSIGTQAMNVSTATVSTMNVSTLNAPYGGQQPPSGARPVAGRAAGGPVMPGETVMVGEKGPELLTMDQGGGKGFVTPNHMLQGIRGLAAGTVPNVPGGTGATTTLQTEAQYVIQSLQQLQTASLVQQQQQLSLVHQRALNTLIADLVATHKTALTNLAGQVVSANKAALAAMAQNTQMARVVPGVPGGTGGATDIQSEAQNVLNSLTSIAQQVQSPLQQLQIQLNSTHEKALAQLVAELKATHQVALVSLADQLLTQNRAAQQSLAQQLEIQALNAESTIVTDAANAFATMTQDISQLSTDLAQGRATAISAASTVATDIANTQAKLIADKSQLWQDQQATKSEYGVALQAGLAKVSLDKITMRFDSEIGAAQARSDRTAKREDVLTSSAQVHLDKVQKTTDARVNAAQKAYDESMKGSNSVLQAHAAEQLAAAKAQQQRQVAQARAQLASAEATATGLNAKAQAAVQSVQNAATLAEARAQAIYNKLSSQAAGAQGTEVHVNITNTSDPYAAVNAAMWELRLAGVA